VESLRPAHGRRPRSGSLAPVAAKHGRLIAQRIETAATAIACRSGSPGSGLTPIRPHVRAYHPASGADRPSVQLQEYGLVRPPIGVDDRVVVAEAGGAIDQQPSNAVRADMAERHRRPDASGRSSLGWRVVVGVAVTHRAGPIVPFDGIHGFALATTIGLHVPSAVPRPDEAI
jgi:hypothetical protein